MAREHHVRASSLSATYNAGRFVADSPQEAIEMAREQYQRSPLGRQMNDVRAFRFYVATPEESECDCD